MPASAIASTNMTFLQREPGSREVGPPKQDARRTRRVAWRLPAAPAYFNTVTVLPTRLASLLYTTTLKKAGRAATGMLML